MQCDTTVVNEKQLVISKNVDVSAVLKIRSLLLDNAENLIINEIVKLNLKGTFILCNTCHVHIYV